MPDDTFLHEHLGLTGELPFDPKWSAAADFLRLIGEHVLVTKPQVIVECSSGLSTLVLARCCELNGSGRVFSLENGGEFAAATRSALVAHGLAGYAEIIDAPLTTYTLEGVDFQWYALTNLEVETIDMLVIDGPPGFLQPLSRYPALPLLHQRLAGNCSVFLDDAARGDEKEIVARWLTGLPGLNHEYIANERGCSVLHTTAL